MKSYTVNPCNEDRVVSKLNDYISRGIYRFCRIDKYPYNELPKVLYRHDAFMDHTDMVNLICHSRTASKLNVDPLPDGKRHLFDIVAEDPLIGRQYYSHIAEGDVIEFRDNSITCYTGTYVRKYRNLNDMYGGHLIKIIYTLVKEGELACTNITPIYE